jgi:hypothetical protein
MIPIKIKYGKRILNLQHPERFNECDEYQLRSIIELIVLNEIPIEERYEDRIMLMQIFLKKNINKYVKDRWFQIMESIVSEGLILQLFELQNFIISENSFNNWIIKQINTDDGVLYGPKDRFAYMQFGEFIVADMLFMQYLQSKQEDLLNKFIAVLYRDKDIKAFGDDDMREEFKSGNLSARSLVIAKLDNITKQSILYNYYGIRAWLADKYKFVFPSEDPDTMEIKLGTDKGGWMSIRRHLAGDVLNLDKVDHVLLHDVLADLNDKMSKE